MEWEPLHSVKRLACSLEAGWLVGPLPPAGSLERAGYELCCGRVEREGGWATWFLWLRRGCPLPRGLRLGAVLAGLWLGVAR